MATTLERYRRRSRRRAKKAEADHQRLDIQGLRMLAVLIVFANHLWHWPRGGFIGVDVFFVVSGFLITGNLLRAAELRGNISFRQFYWNRVRRIVPAATVVLVATYLASVVAFLPFRAHAVGVDAMFAFIFMSNWWFAAKGTDYFTSDEAASPIQHFWSLSIEEQFYFVWPALIFLVSVVVARRAWNRRHRALLGGCVMGVVVAISMLWGFNETTTSHTWAYFSTFSRVWELGVGALLATAIGIAANIPAALKPLLSWVGIALIMVGVYVISDESVGFPVPWAVLPVVGAGLVIVAGVGGEPRYQFLLRNPASTYIGDISYSLYLVHWPVIVILGAVMKPSVYATAAILALSFGLAIASYHFVENPLRRAEWGTLRHRLRSVVHQRSNAYAALSAMALVVLALCAYAFRPDSQHTPVPVIASSGQEAAETAGSDPAPETGPLAAALRGEIDNAIEASEWPTLDPTMEDVLNASLLQSDVAKCTTDAATDPALCTWGSPDAAIKVVLAGDSVALGYAAAMREIALNSGGRIQVLNEAIGGGCAFTEELVSYDPVPPDCQSRKRDAVEYINRIKPDVVIISNRYKYLHVVNSSHDMSPKEAVESLRKLVDEFRSSTNRLVLLAPPPGDVNIKQCFSNRSNLPADCIGHPSVDWESVAEAERGLAQSVGGVWIDSRPWFCSHGSCPSFVGSTPAKRDSLHIAPPYSGKVYPVIEESLTAAGVF